MENVATMPGHPAMVSQTDDQTTVAKKAASDHWFVQVVGGFTLATTMVSALSVFYILLEFGLNYTM